MLIRTLGTNFSEILGEIYSFSWKKMHFKKSSAKGRLFSLGLNELNSSVVSTARGHFTIKMLPHQYRNPLQGKKVFILKRVPGFKVGGFEGLILDLVLTDQLNMSDLQWPLALEFVCKTCSLGLHAANIFVALVVNVHIETTHSQLTMMVMSNCSVTQRCCINLVGLNNSEYSWIGVSELITFMEACPDCVYFESNTHGIGPSF